MAGAPDNRRKRNAVERERRRVGGGLWVIGFALILADPLVASL